MPAISEDKPLWRVTWRMRVDMLLPAHLMLFSFSPPQDDTVGTSRHAHRLSEVEERGDLGAMHTPTRVTSGEVEGKDAWQRARSPTGRHVQREAKDTDLPFSSSSLVNRK
mmetsp:Transcript_41466/g.130635  ORF Transcript_41466/g.130635 Transcript_41466/m.130635 type:complete len:110 (-) Transcript_41466:146-475(-)